jgi:hypothetical protein
VKTMKTAEESWEALDPHIKVALWNDGRTAYKSGYDAAMIEANKMLTEQALKVSPQHQHPHGKSQA